MGKIVGRVLILLVLCGIYAATRLEALRVSCTGGDGSVCYCDAGQKCSAGANGCSCH